LWLTCSVVSSLKASSASCNNTTGTTRSSSELLAEVVYRSR